VARIWREICDTETRRTDRSETTHCRSRLALGLALACAFLSTRSYSPSRPLALAMSLARSHTQPLDIHTNGRLRGSVSKRTETEREREREVETLALGNTEWSQAAATGPLLASLALPLLAHSQRCQPKNQTVAGWRHCSPLVRLVVAWPARTGNRLAHTAQSAPPFGQQSARRTNWPLCARSPGCWHKFAQRPPSSARSSSCPALGGPNKRARRHFRRQRCLWPAIAQIKAH